MFVLRMLLLVIVVDVNMVSSSPKCPPGGTYFDKHVGQYGRMECCSELCQSGFFPAECSKKCPDYDKVKAVDSADGAAGGEELDLKTGNLKKATSPEAPNQTHTLLYTLLAVGAVVVVVVVAVLAKKRGWSKIFTSLTRRGQVRGQRPATDTIEMGNLVHQDHHNNRRGSIQDDDTQGLLDQHRQGQGSDGRRQGDVGRSTGGPSDGAMAYGGFLVNAPNGGLTVSAVNGGPPANLPNGGLPLNVANGRLPVNVANGGLTVNAVNGGPPANLPNGGLPLNVANGRLPVNVANGGLTVNAVNGGPPANLPNGGLPLNVANGRLPVNVANGGLTVNAANGATEETAAGTTPVDCSQFQTASEERRCRAPIQSQNN